MDTIIQILNNCPVNFMRDNYSTTQPRCSLSDETDNDAIMNFVDLRL